MRFRIGPLPDSADFHPDQGSWRRLREPSFGLLMLLALPTSMLIVAGLLFAWGTLARVHGIDQQVQIVFTSGTLFGSVAALAALVVAHELGHAAALPGCGLTSATTVGFWPQKVTPYVYYEGELSRNRCIVVGVMPFLLWSVIPMLVGLLFAWMPLWVVVLSTLNAFFSSGDLIGAVLLVWQTPRSAVVRNKGLETWWRDPE